MRAPVVCPAHRPRDRPYSASEQAAGHFAPLSSLAAEDEGDHCFRCWVLPDACLEVLPVPANSSTVYNDKRSNNLGVGLYRIDRRPFRLHVAGLARTELQARLDRMGSFVKDPLFSQVLRHLERDVVWADNTSASWPPYVRPLSHGIALNTAGGDDELTMVWPFWEKGYGDVIANTLLPFGELLRQGAMPRNLALSGMHHASLLPPLHAATASLCASERPNPPLLPRCASACWSRVRICAPEFFESTRDSWRSTVALDAAIGAGRASAAAADGLRDPSAAVAAAYAAARATDTAAESGGPFRLGAGDSVLRVLIAARHGRRLLANAGELAAACDGVRIGEGVRLRCEMLPPDASSAVKLAALRQTHVYICVWGGDTVHSLHMRRGSGVIELRPSGFAKGAPYAWLELHRRWVTRFSGGAEARPLRFFPVLLPTNASVIAPTEEQCFARNSQKQQRWVKAQQAKGAGNSTAARRRMPDEGWLCYWNADVRVTLAHILPPLGEFLRTARGGSRAVGAAGASRQGRHQGPGQAKGQGQRRPKDEKSKPVGKRGRGRAPAGASAGSTQGAEGPLLTVPP